MSDTRYPIKLNDDYTCHVLPEVIALVAAGRVDEAHVALVSGGDEGNTP